MTDALERTPLILVGDPGWRIAGMSGMGSDDGRATFVRGEHRLDVHWRPGAGYARRYARHRRRLDAEPVALLGRPSTMFAYGPDDFTTVRPVEGESFLEVRGGVGDRSAYLSRLATLRRADVETWTAAMPEDVVVPDERAETISDMLRGVPTPAGFDVAAIPDDQYGDRYHFGVAVVGTVVCAWTRRWQQAVSAGDRAAARTAERALHSSKEWPILLELNRRGDYPDVVWETADEVARGRLPPGHRQALGCRES